MHFVAFHRLVSIYAPPPASRRRLFKNVADRELEYAAKERLEKREHSQFTLYAVNNIMGCKMGLE